MPDHPSSHEERLLERILSGCLSKKLVNILHTGPQEGQDSQDSTAVLPGECKQRYRETTKERGRRARDLSRAQNLDVFKFKQTLCVFEFFERCRNRVPLAHQSFVPSAWTFRPYTSADIPIWKDMMM